MVHWRVRCPSCAHVTLFFAESVPAKQLKRSKRSDMKHSQSESALATPAQQVPEACPAPAVPRALPADWWGHRSGFVAGGVLGSAGERQVKERGPGFSEADQEGLYHLVNVSPGLLTGPWGSSYKSEEEEGVSSGIQSCWEVGDATACGAPQGSAHRRPGMQ